MKTNKVHLHPQNHPVYLNAFSLQSRGYNNEIYRFWSNQWTISFFNFLRLIILIPYQCLTRIFRCCTRLTRHTQNSASRQLLRKDHQSCEYGSVKYFILCGIAGMISCGLTHTALVPLDLIKCRLQVKPQKYINLINGFRVTIEDEGWMGLTKGWAPTLIGYSFQGLGKFGFYEIFKIFYASLLGEQNAYDYRTMVYLLASASAEMFADVALSPWEATKVRIQTKDNWASTLRLGLPKLYAEEGLWGFYKGIVPLWFRQIPYTMMKFACFERTIEAIYKRVIRKPREQCTKSEQLSVTFIAGYISGIVCAIVSHPADTIVSKLNNEKGLHLFDAVRRIGFAGIWKGLGTRILMVGTLTAVQWFIYDTIKVIFSLPRPSLPRPPLLSSSRKYSFNDNDRLLQDNFATKT